MFFFCFLQCKSSWVLALHICTTAVPSCICATAQTQVSKSQTWKGSSWGRKTTLYQRNLFSSLSLSFNFTEVFFRVLTALPFPGRGHTDVSKNSVFWLRGSSWCLLHLATANYSFYTICILKMQRSWVCSHTCTFPRLSTCPAKPGESSGAVWAVASPQVISLLIQKMQLRVTQTNPDL